MSAEKLLKFAPFINALDNGFWHKLTQLKLEVYKTSDNPVPLLGYYNNGDLDGIVPHLNIDYNALDESYRIPPRSFASHGTLRNLNTIEDFRSCDKLQLLKAQGDSLMKDILSGKALDDPSSLSTFLLLTFADLKKYVYYYWFAFPAICLPENIMMMKDPVPISQRFSEKQISSLLLSFDSLSQNNSLNVFLVKEDGDSLVAGSLKDFIEMSSSKVYLGFCDPCTLSSNPGWPLRNFLTLAAYHWADSLDNRVEVICLRDRYRDNIRQVKHSIVLDIMLPSIDHDSLDLSAVKFVGWEKNEKQKMGPRMVNLSESMDPARLAESAVDLNLKLMRWRLLPDLDIDAISDTKCLLLGAGTLGCNVARGLLGWGVRNITLVDNSNISYSNPVRQSLFMFEDCMNGGRHKALTAARTLRQIFPGVNANGIDLSIPMPGHSVPGNCVEEVRNDVQKLEELIESHDAVFLLMDTRESRWLPSVIGAHKRKIVISAALGFDTYLVVRHGVKADDNFVCDGDHAEQRQSGTEAGATATTASLPFIGSRLGCYFCNDVVAPGNSTLDRTLDQQCTVSRSGISMIAAAKAVELLVSIVVHPMRGCAPADADDKSHILSASSQSPLGLVPHQIRGFLARFHVMLPTSVAFDKCTACSDKILKSYAEEGFEFLMKAFNHPTFLEDLTGLTELHECTEVAEIYELSDDYDDDSGNSC